MDERLLPIAAELSKLPGTPEAAYDQDPTEAIQFRAAATEDHDAQFPAESATVIAPEATPADGPENPPANTRPMGCVSGHLSDSVGHNHPCGWGHSEQNEVVEETLEKQGNVSKRQRLSPGGNRRSEKAGEAIRTPDIHVGNVTLH